MSRAMANEHFHAVVTPDRYFPHRYAGAAEDFNPLHIDAEAAASVGLPGNILHGLSTLGLAARLCLEQVGGDPRALARISVQFRGVGVPEEEIEFSGTVAVSAGATSVHFTASQGDRTVLRDGVAELRDDATAADPPR
ncbi:MaoC/PaaZ C-terminal domain-containing protein [Pseudonocardia sulfidoxydans]|nr:MaoC/PaaZ C-terminal domain-containing protein [Pseudonocardia sulfidoxydans]